MAGFDGRGPQGMGPMSGRGRGRCNFAASGQGIYNGGAGFGARRGFGGGRCFGRRAAEYGNFGQTAYQPSPGDELELLKARAESLKETLDTMARRIQELQGDRE